MKTCNRGPEPFIPGPNARKPSPPVVTVNGQGPDENGNVTVVLSRAGLVQSVNGYGPNAFGAVRIPKKISGYGAPTVVAGSIEGDTYFDMQSRNTYHFVLLGDVLTWVRDGLNSTARSYAEQIAGTDTSHMKDSEKTALLQKLAAYVKAKEGL